MNIIAISCFATGNIPYPGGIPCSIDTASVLFLTLWGVRVPAYLVGLKGGNNFGNRRPYCNI